MEAIPNNKMGTNIPKMIHNTHITKIVPTTTIATGIIIGLNSSKKAKMKSRINPIKMSTIGPTISTNNDATIISPTASNRTEKMNNAPRNNIIKSGVNNISKPTTFIGRKIINQLKTALENIVATIENTIIGKLSSHAMKDTTVMPRINAPEN
jgi:hypothetical protein